VNGNATAGTQKKLLSFSRKGQDTLFSYYLSYIKKGGLERRLIRGTSKGHPAGLNRPRPQGLATSQEQTDEHPQQKGEDRPAGKRGKSLAMIGSSGRKGEKRILE